MLNLKINKNFVEIRKDMFYNTNNIYKMGGYVVNPILLLTADSSATFTATVVISGILIVVGVLLLLIGVFALFGKIVPVIEQKTRAREEKSAKRKAERKAKKDAKKALKKNASNAVSSSVSEKPVVKTEVNTPPAPAPAPVVEEGISGEVVAAIAAAVAMTEGGGAVVRSIRKKNIGGRNPWAQAANIDNTRPF